MRTILTITFQMAFASLTVSSPMPYTFIRAASSQRFLATAWGPSTVLLALIANPGYAQERELPKRSVDLPTVTVTGEEDTGVVEKTGAYTTDAMSTATGLSLSVRQTPQAVSVITRQMMDDRGMQTAAEALQSAPGLSVTRSDTNRYAFSSRGFDIDNFQFDGLTQPVLTPWSFGENNLDLAVFDRVEIVRGATGLMTGAGNPSAAVNYVRKRPLRDFAASAGVDIGSWDMTRGYADISSPLTEDGRIRGRLVAAYAKANSYTKLQDTVTRTLYGVVTAELTRSTTLTGGLTYQFSGNNGFGSGFPLFYRDGTRTDFSRSIANNAAWARIENDITTGFLDLNHDFANDWRFRAVYNRSITDASQKNLYRGGYPDRQSGLGTTNTFTHYRGDLRRSALNLSFSGPFQMLGRRHELSFGWMQSEDELAYPQYRALAPLPDVASIYNPGATPEPVWSSVASQADDLHNKQSGGYIVGRFSLADPLWLIVGGRISDWETKQDYFGTQRQYRYKNEFVPYAGLLLDLGDTYTVYASYTEIFKPQNARDEQGGILPPITGKSYELGLKAGWFENRLNGAIALFRTRQDNLAEVTGNNVVGAPANTPAYRPVAGAKVEGVELEVGGELSPNWNVTGSVTTFIAEDAKGNPINTNKPRSLFKLYTTYRLPGQFNRLTVGGGVDWQSRMYQNARAPGNRIERVQQDSYALVSLMARYALSKHVSATLNLNNVLDKKYYSQIGFYDQGWYGAPRNVTFSLRRDF